MPTTIRCAARPDKRGCDRRVAHDRTRAVQPAADHRVQNDPWIARWVSSGPSTRGPNRNDSSNAINTGIASQEDNDGGAAIAGRRRTSGAQA